MSTHPDLMDLTPEPCVSAAPITIATDIVVQTTVPTPTFTILEYVLGVA